MDPDLIKKILNELAGDVTYDDIYGEGSKMLTILEERGMILFSIPEEYREEVCAAIIIHTEAKEFSLSLTVGDYGFFSDRVDIPAEEVEVEVEQIEE